MKMCKCTLYVLLCLYWQYGGFCPTLQMKWKGVIWFGKSRLAKTYLTQADEHSVIASIVASISTFQPQLTRMSWLWQPQRTGFYCPPSTSSRCSHKCNIIWTVHQSGNLLHDRQPIFLARWCQGFPFSWQELHFFFFGSDDQVTRLDNNKSIPLPWHLLWIHN